MSPLVPGIGLWVHGTALGLTAAAVVENFGSIWFVAAFAGFNFGCFVISVVGLTKASAA